MKPSKALTIIKHEVQVRIYWVGLLLIIIGSVLAISDWGAGENANAGGYLSMLAFMLVYSGTYILIKLKKKNKSSSLALAFLFPMLLYLGLIAYTSFIIMPQIEKKGIHLKAIVIARFMKGKGNGNLDSAVYYEYTVKSKKYVKAAFNCKLEIGDSIPIIYLESNPHFHKAILYD